MMTSTTVSATHASANERSSSRHARWQQYLQDLSQSVPLSRFHLKSIIQGIQAETENMHNGTTSATGLPSEVHAGIAEPWQVVVTDGETTLVVPDGTGKMPLRIVPLEDYFDVIESVHSGGSDGHLDAEQTETKVKMMYASIPSDAVQLFVDLCEVCQGQKESLSTSQQPSALSSVTLVPQPVTRNNGEEFPLVEMTDLLAQKEIVEKSEYCWVTPMLHDCRKQVGIKQDVELHLKLENMQNTGSFKVRGVVGQMEKLMSDERARQRPLVTMSGGNYGKAFAYMLNKLQLDGLVLMPNTAPPSRATLIKSLGVNVELCPLSELKSRVDQYVKEKNMLYLQPFDDPVLIACCGSIGFEILSEVKKPDVVLVCCGGGGSLSGIAAAIRLSEAQQTDPHRCRIYGVEPTTARTMYESFRHNMPVCMPTRSVAAGLSPPFAGVNTYKHCRSFVDDILLVEDAEIRAAMFTLFSRGITVEPSGAAAFAALQSDKVPDVEGKRVVVVLTGGNITPSELNDLASDT